MRFLEKKLPKVFANKIEKEFNNNERVYYERSNEPIKISEKTMSYDIGHGCYANSTLSNVKLEKVIKRMEGKIDISD